MDDRKPSRKWFALPIALFALAIGIIAVSLVLFIRGLSGERPKIDPTGTTIVTLEKGGKVDIAYEYRVFSNLSQDLNLTFAFENTETGTTLHSQFPTGSMTYEMNGLHGIVIATAQLESGTYKITSDAGEQLDIDIVILVDSPFRIIGGFVLATLGGCVALLGGIAATVVIVAKRNRYGKMPIYPAYGPHGQPPMQ